MIQYIIASAAGFLAGAAGAMGLGGGSVLLMYLTLGAGMEQLRAQGVNLIFFIPCAIIALLIHGSEGRLRWKILLPAAAFGLAGALVGYWLGGVIGGAWLGKLFGAFLIVLGVRELLPARRAKVERTPINK